MDTDIYHKERCQDVRQKEFHPYLNKSIRWGKVQLVKLRVVVAHIQKETLLYEILKSQGMQNNQLVTFLSDGGDTVRDLQLFLNPEAEHLLDWVHITMRITVMKQMA